MARRNGTDVWKLAPIDAPEEPEKGMYFWVQTGDHWAIGTRHTISRVNSRSFYVSVDGRKERIDRRDWHRWLRERSEEGYLLLNGHPVRDPTDEPLACGLRVPISVPKADTDDDQDGKDTTREGTMDTNLRDTRVLRAVRDVLKQYSLTRSGPDKDGFLQVEVKRPGATYKVRIDPAWRLPPTCTCPDAKRVKDGKGATFCKHTIAALLSDEEHRHQLIDLLL